MSQVIASRRHAPAVASSSLTCEIVGMDWLCARADAWDQLVAEASFANPFYARRIISAHVAHGLASPELRFIVVHRGQDLLALLPVQARGARLGFFRRAAAAWMSPYIVTSTPLVARHGGEEAIDALVAGFKAAAGGSLWLLPFVALDSAVAATLQARLALRQWPLAALSTFERAVFEGRDPGAYDAHLGAGRRKDLQRRRRRLAERGYVEVRSTVGGEGLRQAVEDFLALELKGWKGAAGTALACREHTAGFLRATFADNGGPVTCRADMLTLDGRPVAVSLAFVCGGTAYLFKTAYDETLRRYAPGVLLEDEIVRACQVGFAERLNSASIPGGVLDSLYPHRERIGDLLFATDGVPPEALARIARQELGRRRAVGYLKRLSRRVRAGA